MPGSPRSVIELMFSSCTDVARVLRGCMPLRSSAVGDINSMAERYGQQLSSMLISPYEGSNTSPLGRMPWIKRLSLRTLRFSSTPIIHHWAIRMQRMHVIEVGSRSLYALSDSCPLFLYTQGSAWHDPCSFAKVVSACTAQFALCC